MSTPKKTQTPARKAVKKKATSRQVDENGLTIREKKFADGVLAGRPAGRAYEEAGYTAKGASADTQASMTLRNPKVSAYIKEQRRIDAEKNQIERWEIIGYLARVLKTPVGQVDENSDLAQEVVREEVGEMTSRTRVRMVPKMDAAKQLCQMLGFNEPEQVKVTYEVVIGPGANE